MNSIATVWYESFALEILIKTTLILTLSLGLCLVSYRHSAAWRHWIWSLGFLGCLTLPFLAILLPVVPIVIQTETLIYPATAMIVDPATVNTEQPDIATLVWRTFLIVYATGVVVQLSRLTAAAIRVRRITIQAQTAPRSLATRLDYLQVIMGIARPIKLRMSDKVTSPMTHGALNPVLILPSSMTSWTADDQRAALAHELAHIRGVHWLLLLGAKFVCALHWFNPLFWYALTQFERECERTCDDAVLRIGIRPSTYANQLVSLAKQQLNLQPASLAMIGRPPLADRVHAILNPSERRETMNRLRVSALCCLATAALVPLAACQAVRATAADASADPTTVIASDTETNVVPVGDEIVEPTAPKALAPVPVATTVTPEPPAAPQVRKIQQELQESHEALIQKQHELHREAEALTQELHELEREQKRMEHERKELERTRPVNELERREFEQKRQHFERQREALKQQMHNFHRHSQHLKEIEHRERERAHRMEQHAREVAERERQIAERERRYAVELEQREREHALQRELATEEQRKKKN